MAQQFESCQIGFISGRPALTGAVDYPTCRYVDSWLSHAAPSEIDVIQVPTLDSFGLRVLLDARIRHANFRMNPSEAVRGVLQSSGTFEYLGVLSSACRASGKHALS
jgi:hypothetical protein